MNVFSRLAWPVGLCLLCAPFFGAQAQNATPSRGASTNASPTLSEVVEVAYKQAALAVA